jgi:hypothetical protein
MSASAERAERFDAWRRRIRQEIVQSAGFVGKVTQQRPVDRDGDGVAGGQCERCLDRAASESSGHGGAQFRFELIGAGRQFEAEFEAAAVDAADFPQPGEGRVGTSGAGESGHRYNFYHLDRLTPPRLCRHRLRRLCNSAWWECTWACMKVV